MAPTRRPSPRRSPPRPAEGLESRRAAQRLFEAALERRGGLEAACHETVFLALAPRDRAFARQIVLTTLRRLRAIDALLDARLTRSPPTSVLALLRLAAAQILFLETPAFAAVDSAVALAPRAFKPLVNAVLRQISSATGGGGPRSGGGGRLRRVGGGGGPGRGDGEGPEKGADPADLAPAWLLSRWRANFGAEAARAIDALIAEAPATDLAFKAPPEPDLLAALAAEPLAGGGARTRLQGDPVHWPAFEEGAWWVQDAAAQLPARLLAAHPGEAVLDLCAAPGGKTLQLAASGAMVIALDRSAGRLSRLEANLRRTGLLAEIVAADALAWMDARRFSAILLDAPCSATGTFRRRPDVLWNARASEIAGLAELQRRLLSAAAGRLEAGGRLVYSVCSLEPEEGEGVLRTVLAGRTDLRLDPISAGEAERIGAPAASLAKEGWLRVLPCHLEGGLDGFLIARLLRAV
ncbi:MAG: RsmB/NOP family class I SAM-dependent RNA methyltransferase [Caulobacteraceae bacterium]